MTDSDRIDPLAGTAPAAKNPDSTDKPAHAAEKKPSGTTDSERTPSQDTQKTQPDGEVPPPKRGRGRPRKTEAAPATSGTQQKAATSGETPAASRTAKSKTASPKAAQPTRSRTAPAAVSKPTAGTEPVTTKQSGIPVGTTPVAGASTEPSAEPVRIAPMTDVSAESARTAPAAQATETSAFASADTAAPALTLYPVQAPVLAAPVLPVASPPSAVPATSAPVVPRSAPVVDASARSDEASGEDDAPAKRRRSRRSGRGRKRAVDGAPESVPPTHAVHAVQAQVGSTAEDEAVSVQPGTVIALGEPGAPDKPKSRSRRRKSGTKPAPIMTSGDLFSATASDAAGVDSGTAIPLPAAEQDVLFLRDDEPFTDALVEEAVDAAVAEEEPGQTPRKRSRGRGRKKAAAARAAAAVVDDVDDVEPDDDESDDEESVNAGRIKRTASGEPRKMLVSVLPGDQVEVVLAEENKVCEYYVEMTHQAKIRGNIYKGVINNIDANLQAAFVNYGNVKNGFLQIDEVHPEYYLQPHEPMKGRKYPPMQKVLKAGQEVLVQVVKEPTGNKGAFLTTWVSLAGRFLVLTPGQEQIGISRKVEDGEERNRLRELIKGLDPGEGLGAIVRTVSAGTSKTTLQKDLSFLKRVWKDIRKRATTEKSPSLIYQEPGLASRSVRDYLSDDVTEVWVDDADTAEAIREMAGLLFPRKADLVHLYEDRTRTLWEHFGVLKQIEQVQAREVIMPSGGRLVFDQTEALMAIDINSGRIGGKTNFESMAHRTNMEAAVAIAQQLRLRDIGGQIVIDFIEMRDPEHGRDVEKALRNAMKGDRARHDIGKMSSFGLLQIVRQRTGSSAISISMEPCPHCKGTGQRRNIEWQAVQALRDLHRAMRTAAGSGQAECSYAVDAELGLYLLNHKRERLAVLEKECNIRLEIRINGVSPAPVAAPQPNGKPV